MKLLVSLLFIFVVTYGAYLFSSRTDKGGKKQKKSNKRPLLIAAAFAVVLIGLLASLMYKDATAEDAYCTTTHIATSHPPITLTSALDYFLQGNYAYDIGNCDTAITAYTTSIKLNPIYPEAYNNRAYTYMRMRNYGAALLDLNKALELKPDYIQALMNRGDIHNYYYQINRKSAIVDYKKVISLGGARKTSVCAHLFLAKHNGWNVGTLLDLPGEIVNPCN